MSYLFYITAVLYVASTLSYIVYLSTHRNMASQIGLYLIYGGFVFHTLTVGSQWLETGIIPVLTLSGSLTLFSWLTIATYLSLIRKYSLPVLGAFIMPLTLLFFAGAMFLPSKTPVVSDIFGSYWFDVHIILAFTGNAFFALAFIFALMYLIQEKYLKSRKLGGMYFLLPPLDVLDELNYRCLCYGFPLLTFAIITGAIWSHLTFGIYWMWKHRQIFSLVVWLLYAVLLHGRITVGWRGKRAALLSVSAFVVLIASYLIINIILGSGHGLATIK